MVVLTGTQNKKNLDRWIENELAQIHPGSRLLDAGAGEMQYKKFCAHLVYVSQDFDQYDGKGDNAAMQTGEWKQGLVDIVCDIKSIPEPDASFDAILCTEVLEHLPHPVDALRELSRLLKPGGKLILTAPFASLSHFTPYFYSTGFSRYFYEYWLNHLGMQIDELHLNGNYFEYLAQELRRLPSMSLRYAIHKPNWMERQAMKLILRWLEKSSRVDKGSSELLCYGIQVVAHRVST